MNEYRLTDPELARLESQLIDLTPRLKDDDQRAILYRCGWTAGRRQVSRVLKFWQGISLALLVLGVTLRFTASLPSTTTSPVSVVSPDHLAQESPVTDPNQSTLAVGPDIAKLNLDAWSVPADQETNDELRIARGAPSDPRVRLITVASLSHDLNQTFTP